MFRITFETTSGPPRDFSEEGDCLRIEGPHLRLGSNGVTAEYDGGLWRLGDETFTAIFVRTSIIIDFEDSGALRDSYGPFSEARIVDGLVLGGPGIDRPLAIFLDKERVWKLYAEEEDVTTFVIVFREPVSGPTGI